MVNYSSLTHLEAAAVDGGGCAGERAREPRIAVRRRVAGVVRPRALAHLLARDERERRWDAHGAESARRRLVRVAVQLEVGVQHEHRVVQQSCHVGHGSVKALHDVVFSALVDMKAR